MRLADRARHCHMSIAPSRDARSVVMKRNRRSSRQNRIRVQLEGIVDLCVLQRLEALWLKICRARSARVASVKAKEEKVIVVLPSIRTLCFLRTWSHSQCRKLWHGVKRGRDEFFYSAVFQKTVHLVLWHPERVPIEEAVVRWSVAEMVWLTNFPKTRAP